MDAQAHLPPPPDNGTDRCRLDDAPRVRHHRLHLLRQRRFAAEKRHHRLRQTGIQEKIEILCRSRLGQVASRIRQNAPRVRQTAASGQGHTAHQRQARVLSDHLARQETIRRDQPIDTLAKPQPDAPGIEQNRGEQRHVVRVRRVSHRRHGPAPTGQRTRDVAMNTLVAQRSIPAPPACAMVPDQRMQLPDLRSVPAHRHQKTIETANLLQAPQDVALAECIVQQLRVHPIEKAGIEQ